MLNSLPTGQSPTMHESQLAQVGYPQGLVPKIRELLCMPNGGPSKPCTSRPPFPNTTLTGSKEENALLADHGHS